MDGISGSLIHLRIFASGILLYSLVCGAAILTGHGLVRVARLRITDDVALLIAPVLCHVFWSLVLGIGVAFRLPVKAVAPWLWCTSALLSMYSVRIRWTALRRAGPLLLLCAALPLVVMARYFWGGLEDYIGSIAPDGWSHIAAGQYMWEFPRGTEGGLAPLYQYASHLSRGRWMCYAVLGFFSVLVRPGDTQAVGSLLQAWSVFSMACGIALFWVAAGWKTGVVVTATILSTVAGWVANMIWANNFDNGLALVYLPALGSLGNLLDIRGWAAWLLAGVLFAAATYTYPEYAPLIIAAGGLMLLQHVWQQPHPGQVLLLGSSISLACALILILPMATDLVAFLPTRYGFTYPRPGEGVFPGLVNRHFEPAAFFGLGAERQIERYNDVRNVLGYILAILSGLGFVDLARQGNWGLVTASITLSLSALYLILWQNYPYAAYKLILFNWWSLVGAGVVGAQWLLASIRQRRLRHVALASFGVLATFLLSQSIYTSVARTPWYIESANPELTFKDFREVRSIKQIVGADPMLVAVDDWLANEWAVYFLRDMHISIAPYRMYMALPHVVPLMDRAQSIQPATIRYMLTDASVGVRASWKLVWTGGPYRLWRSEDGTLAPSAPAASGRERRTDLPAAVAG